MTVRGCNVSAFTFCFRKKIANNIVASVASLFMYTKQCTLYENITGCFRMNKKAGKKSKLKIGIMDSFSINSCIKTGLCKYNSSHVHAFVIEFYISKPVFHSSEMKNSTKVTE